MFELGELFNFESPLGGGNFEFTEEDDLVSAGIDIPKLVKTIKGGKRVSFSYKKYKSDFYSVYPAYQKNGPNNDQIKTTVWAQSSAPNSKLFSVSDENGKKHYLDLDVKLHTDSDVVDFGKREIKIGFDYSSESGWRVEYQYLVPYANSKRINYGGVYGPKISERKELDKSAVFINAFSYSDFELLLNYFEKPLTGDEQETIISRFHSARNLAVQKKSTDILGLVYRNAPEFYFSRLNKSQIYGDLIFFLKQDEKYWSIDDESSDLLVLLSRFGDPQFLYDQFNKNPKDVVAIYENLDGTKSSIFHEGKEVHTKTIFASFLFNLCTLGKVKISSERKKKKYHFKHTSEFKLDSNAWGDGGSTFFLKQREITWVYTDEVKTDEGKTLVAAGNKKIVRDVDEGDDYHPLDMVFLSMSTQGGGEIALEVPAIFVKDIAFHGEWGEIMKIIRIGAGLVFLIIGIITLGTASGPLLVLLAMIEIGVALTDMVIIANEDQLMQSEKGLQFLENYNNITMGLAIVTGIPVLIRSTLKLGAKLLGKTTIDATRRFLAVSLAKLILESNISSFSLRSAKHIQFGKHWLKTDGIASLSDLTRLENNNATMLRFTDDNGKAVGYGMLYEGEIIISGGANEVRRKLDNMLKFRGSSLTSALNDLWKLTPKLDESGKYWESFNKAGNKMRWRNQFAPGQNIFNTIKQYIKRGGDKGWEGEVMQEFFRYDEVVNFSNKVDNMTTLQPAGDIDGEVAKYFIECKASLSLTTLENGTIRKQLLKYLDVNNEKYINALDKKAVLCVKRLNGLDISHVEIRKLVSEFNKIEERLIIIHGLNDIKKLY